MPNLKAASKNGYLTFRNFLTTDKQPSKALSFSPDIIPQFGNVVTPAVLVQEFDSFVSLPLQPSEDNNIYVRGKTVANIVPPGATAVVLRAVPSELILWPQVWNETPILGPGPLIIQTKTPNTPVALDEPFTIRPPNLGGFSYALVATQATVPNIPAGIRLRDALPPPPPAAHNWKDYYKFLTTDTTTAYYNVLVADPTAPMISVTTRLRLFDDSDDAEPLQFSITIEHASMPPATNVSLSSASGNINMERTPVGDGGSVIGVEVSLPPGFDEIVTFTIYLPEETVIEPFSWLSLQASVVEKGTGSIDNYYLIGAQNVVFDADATRNLRFVSPGFVRSRAKSQVATPQHQVAPPQHQVAPPQHQVKALTDGQGTPAVGWWFRDDLGNNSTNSFPRNGAASHSPDIQPAGTKPDSNIVADIGGGNSGVDYSDTNNVSLMQGFPNYVYLRGNCTLADYKVESRLFCVPNNVLLHPSTYSKQWSVDDFDSHGNPIVAVRPLTTTQANGFNVIDNPFNILNPAPPSNYGGDHYCLVAETRHTTTTNPDPQWPHEKVGDFATGDDFNSWICGTPSVAWRNVSYVGGADSLTFTTVMTIPANIYPSSTDWTLQVSGVNVAVGSAWQLTGSGPAIPGVSIGFEKTNITATNMIQGCHFSGLPSAGYTAQLVLEWFSNGQTMLNGMTVTFSLHTTTNAAAPLYAFAVKLPKVADKWHYTVGENHPGLSGNYNGKNHYLGRRFDKPGPQAWPHKKKGVNADVVPTKVFGVGSDTYKVT